MSMSFSSKNGIVNLQGMQGSNSSKDKLNISAGSLLGLMDLTPRMIDGEFLWKI